MPRHCRPRLEPLEGRWLPATLVWTGAVNSRWEVAGNWDLRQAPTANDDVVIDRPGAVVRVSSGSRQAARVTSTQTLEVVGGTLTLGAASADPTPSKLATLRLLGGTLAVAALEVSASFAWSAGTLKGNTVSVSGTSTLDGGNKTLDRVEFRNLGSLLWSAGRVRVANKATFANAGGAMFLVSAAGTRFDPPLLNQGNMVVASAGVVETNAFTQAGTLALHGGTLKPLTFSQTDGVTALEGGGLASAKAVTLAGGSLTGSGTVSADVNNVAGRIAPGTTLVVAGNLTQGGAAGLVIALQAGGGGSQVVVTGRASLDGELVVQLVGVPTDDTSYTVLTGGPVAGSFKAVRLFAPGTKAAATVGEQSVVVDAAPIRMRPEEPPPAPARDGGAEEADAAEEAEADAEPPPLLSQLFGGQTGLPQGPWYGQGAQRLGDAGGGADLGGGARASASRDAPGASRAEEPLAFADVVSALPAPALPELEPASDRDLIGSADLVASLLLGGRVRPRLSAQGGAALSAVATVLSDDGAAARAGLADAALGGLLIDPVGRLGDWPDAVTAAPPAGPAALAQFAPAAVLALAGVAAAAREGRSRRASGSRRKRRGDGG